MPITTLQGQLFTEQTIIAATKAVTPVSKFARRFEEAYHGRGAAIRVPTFAVKPAKTFADDYTADADTASGVDIPIDTHIFDNKEYSDVDFAQCPVAFWKGAGQAVGRSIGLGIASRVVGKINKTNVPKTATNEKVLTVASLNKKAIADLLNTAEAADVNPAEAVLLCSGEMFTAILSFMDANVYGGPEAVRNGSLAEGCYGFGHIMRCNAFSTASGENLVGSIVHRDAIGYAGAPVTPQCTAALDEYGVATDPESGLAIGFRRFADVKSGKNYMIGEALLGAKVLQPTKIVRLVSAATA